ncbi:hypothetical protein FO519_004862 [Halicephalobus sp. NKZ332]|nr:hypothetical protein FO519_004862 [Halicephalobus sp. NKZ332]
MAFLAGSGNGTPPGVSATAPVTTAANINPDQVPQPVQQTSGVVNPIAQTALYQQLLLQNQLQQQQSVPQQSTSGLTLQQLQQLSAALNQGPQTQNIPAVNPALLQIQGQQSQLNNILALLQQQQVQQQAQINPTTALLNTLLNSLQNQTNFQQLAPALNLLTNQQNVFQNSLQQNNQNDETKVLLEYLMRQQQQQELAAMVAAAASATQTPRGSLSTQNSSNSLLGQPATVQSHGSRSSGEAVYVSIPPSTSVTNGGPLSSNFGSNESSGVAPPTTSRQTSAERLFASGQSVEDHISRLISENAAIVEPNPVLLKRRPYNRQNTSSSITSNTGNNPDQSGSPGIGSPGLQTPSSRIPTTRSQSLHEPGMLSALRIANGSLTSGQPIVRNNGDKILTCSACGVKFANEIGLEMHQSRCGKKDLLFKQHSQPQLSLNTNSGYQNPQQLLLQQQKLNAEHQTRIAALIGGGAGVAPDAVLQANTGRSSVPVGTGTSGSLLNSPPLVQQLSGVPGPSSRKGSLQSPYPTERQHSKKRLLENIKPEEFIDVVTVGDSRPESPGSNPPNSVGAPGKPEPMDTETAPTKMAKIPYCEPSTSFSKTVAIVPHNPPDASGNVVQDPTEDLSPESKATREMVQIQLACYERRIEPMPYVITYGNHEMSPIVNNDVNAAVNRRMLKTLTNCSKTCDTVPHVKVFGSGESQFAFYKQAAVQQEHVEQLFQYLACYSIKPKVNVKSHCVYTIASDKSTGAHPNHSRAVPMIISRSQQPAATQIQCPVTSQSPTPNPKPNLPEPVKMTSEPPSGENLARPNPVKENNVRYANNTDELMSKKRSFPGAEYAAVAAKIKPISGGRSEEVEVYVRGRGRGRYVCDRCGIKCKKPSMLKKHLKSHTNIRPYHCIACNFSFKTKGNLTKHLFSKAHRRKLEERGSKEQPYSPGLRIVDEDDDESGRQEENEKIEKHIRMESQFVDDLDDEEIDEMLMHPIVSSQSISYRRFGQENIIYERETHTPPTLWTLWEQEGERCWPKPDMERSCHSAPPVIDETKEKSSPSRNVSCAGIPPQALPQTEPNIGLIVIQQMMKDGSKFAESVSRGDQEAQMQFTNEVVRMSRGIVTSGFMLPLIKNHEVLEPPKKKFFPGMSVPIIPQIEEKGSLSAFVLSENFNCDQCSRKFRKESELNLHKQTHLIEKQIKNSRASKNYQCPECRTIMRSKAVLVKHVETVHPGVDVDTALALARTSPAPYSNGLTLNTQIGSSSFSAVSSPSISRPGSGPPTGRSFICTDCNLGFRTHGVLAKHLRTKNHVKALCASGRLPEDALSIIRDNTSVLSGVDASDCEAARNSLLEIIGKIRKSSTSSGSGMEVKIPPSSNSLECTEELSSVSPTPRLPDQGFRQRGSSPTTRNDLTGLKRQLDEPSSPLHAKRRLTVSPSDARQTFSGNGLLGANQMSSSQRYSISDIWIPPKAEDVEGSGTRASSTMERPVNSNPTDGNLSDATSRSETSTPQQKPSFNINTPLGITPLGVAITKCQLCDDEFETPSELQVHFQSEHICMRDGSYFQCPNSTCEKVYPSKEALRIHLLAHYRSGAFIESPVADREDEFAPPTNQSAVSPEEVLSNGGAASPAGLGRKNSRTAHTAPKHSPGAPEESHTLIGIKVEPSINVNNVKNDIERLVLKCNQCNSVFINADELQIHYAVHFNRPHVCSICDAGFTTSEALKAHTITHP